MFRTTRCVEVNLWTWLSFGRFSSSSGRKSSQSRKPPFIATIRKILFTFKKDTGNQIENLKKDMSNQIQDLKKDTSHQIQDLKKDTSHQIQDLKKDTSHQIQDLKKDTDQKMQKMIKNFDAIHNDLSQIRGLLSEQHVSRALASSREKRSGSVVCKSLGDLAMLLRTCIKKSDSRRPEKIKDSLWSRLNSSSEQLKIEDYVEKLIAYSVVNKSVAVDALVRGCKVQQQFAEAFFSSSASGSVDLPRLNTKNPIEIEISKFIKLSGDLRSKKLRSDSGVGMLFFTAACGHELVPTHEIEFDEFPSISCSEKVIDITTHEVKSSFSLVKTAIPQLRLRLCVLEKAMLAVFGNNHLVVKKGCISIPIYSKRSNSHSTQVPKCEGFELFIDYY